MVVTLVVQTQPPKIMSSRARDVSVNVYVDCTAKGEPFPLIKWVLPDGSQMKPTQFIGSRIFIFPNGTLYIKNVNPSDSGRYECSATNPVGFAKRTVQMDVRQEAPGPWKGLYQQHSVTATYGSTVFLHCPESVGSHREFLWILPNGTALNPGMKLRRFIHYLGNGTLHITQPGVIDKGVYRCLAKNVAGQAEKRYALEPGQKPQIRSTASTMKISFGQTLNMPCNADDFFSILYLIYEIISLYIFIYSTV
uniref:Ig-like domain-containing protein n=1 Tax=Sinocyclocheilus rhinocerous TaxID=307959 RepID=A0A673NH67_9TELE